MTSTPDFSMELIARSTRCIWVDAELSVSLPGQLLPLVFSEETLEDFDYRLPEVLNEIEEVWGGNALDIREDILTILTYWQSTPPVFIENGQYQPISHEVAGVTHIFDHDEVKEGCVRAGLNIYELESTMSGYGYATYTVNQVHIVPIAWFDQFSPGASQRLVTGLSLGLTPAALADYVRHAPAAAPSVTLPDNLSMEGLLT